LEEKMKKLALILALLIIPCTAFGMQMLDDNSMDTITGQSGVSIALDDIQVFINIDTMAYIDSDGLNSSSIFNSELCNGAAGAIAVNDFQIDVLNINAIVGTLSGGVEANTIQSGSNIGLYSASCGRIPLLYNYASSAAVGSDYLNGSQGQAGLQGLATYFIPNAISIDVTDELPILTQGANYAASVAGGTTTFTVGGVNITLPTLEINIGSLSLTPYYTGDVDGLTSIAINNNDDFGTFELDGVNMAILSGWIEIAPH
jgi:hypothetical protein